MKIFKFIGHHYKIGNRAIRLELNDEVIIHPTKWGRSQAKKSYPAKVELKKVSGAIVNGKEITEVVCLTGIKDNSGWHGAWINQYAFNRLEFVKRSINK